MVSYRAFSFLRNSAPEALESLDPQGKKQLHFPESKMKEKPSAKTIF